MQRIVRKRVRHKADGIDLAADVHIALSVNHGETGASERPDDADEQRVDARRDDRQPPEEGRTT